LAISVMYLALEKVFVIIGHTFLFYEIVSPCFCFPSLTDSRFLSHFAEIENKFVMKTNLFYKQVVNFSCTYAQ